MSLEKLTQAPEHALGASLGQAQVPFWQVCPPLHITSQSPQLKALFRMSVQLPAPQSFWPGGQAQVQVVGSRSPSGQAFTH